MGNMWNGPFEGLYLSSKCSAKTVTIKSEILSEITRKIHLENDC
jgi:hypothetical protein